MLGVYLDGRFVTSVPDHLKPERVQKIVADTVLELGIGGVVEVKPVEQHRMVRRYRNTVNALPQLIR
jgi:hypothetical protein